MLWESYGVVSAYHCSQLLLYTDAECQSDRRLPRRSLQGLA
jgi:hypothetical protein